MKKILFSLLSAFMVSTMASAQYLNVKLKDGTYHSYKTSSDMEVSFGDKKGTDPTESTQTVTVNGHTVAVKLADDTPASEVMLSIYAEGDAVKIEAYSKLNYGLWCSRDDNCEDSKLKISNGFYTFTLYNISKDMVVTVGYINVSFDLNNSKLTDNFKAKPEDITKMRYGSTIPLTYVSAEKHSFRGWYTDKECTEAWNFSAGVTKSMTLYAKWAEDPSDAQINGHDYVKLGGYYWATENINRYMKQADAIEASRNWNKLDESGPWTLPSEAHWQALLDYCNWKWENGGYLVTGREGTYESNNSIFLPAASRIHLGKLIEDQVGVLGFYWSTGAERFLHLNEIDGPKMITNNFSNSSDDAYSVRLVAE